MKKLSYGRGNSSLRKSSLALFCIVFFVLFCFSLKIFQGNHDRYAVATEFIDPPIIAQYVRVKPKTWDGFICMRMEFYGCTEGEKALPI